MESIQKDLQFYKKYVYDTDLKIMHGKTITIKIEETLNNEEESETNEKENQIQYVANKKDKQDLQLQTVMSTTHKANPFE